MIEIANADIVEQHRLLTDYLNSGPIDVLRQSKFFTKAFGQLEERALADRLQAINKVRSKQGLEKVSTPYPYEVRIAKDVHSLINGDLEPARVITVTEPFKGPYSNMWFGNTLKGINLRWGYLNGDSRKIAEHGLNDTTVHGFLCGATGQGKSVTLNSIIYGCCTEYPPWELTMTLSDAKIVEFKSIAVSNPMPHIDIIAATADADYMISMLEMKHHEMMLRQTAFTKAGEILGKKIANIKDFREITGLVMPRCLMIFDECTAMFQNAGQKKAGKIAELIDSIARLGRNAGFHLLLTSQEVSSDLPAKTLANLTLRGAMGCFPEVSNRILGNEEAVKNMGKKGRMIANTQSAQKNSEIYNQLVRVPFADDKEVSIIAGGIIEQGKSLGVANVLRFYDEEERLYYDKYKKFIESFEFKENRILLGPPSYIINDEEQVVKIEFKGENVESICVFANLMTSKVRALTMLKLNLLRFKNASHVVLCIDPQLYRDGKVDEIPAVVSYSDKDFATSDFFELARSQIYKRMLLIKADELAFNDGKANEVSDQLFYQVFDKGGKFDTPINRCRAKYFLGLLDSDLELRKGFQLDNCSNYGELRLEIMESCFAMLEQFNSLETQIKVEKMTNVFMWALGLERMIGLCVDARGSNLAVLKTLLRDGTAYRVRFILFTSDFEALNGLQQSLGFMLLEDISTKQVGQIKASDFYPPTLSSGLMVLYQPPITNDSCISKFKKLSLEGEL